MKNIFTTLLLFIISVHILNAQQISLTPEEKKWIKNNPNITFSTSSTNPPHSFIDTDRKAKGIQIDIIDLIAQKIGITIHKKPSIWPEPLNSAMAHKVDGIVDSAKRKEREKALNFTEVYLKAPYALVALEGKENIQNLNQFCGKKVAVTFGTSIAKFLQKHYPCIKLVDSYTENMVEKVVKKEVDAFFERYEVIMFQDKNALLSGIKVIYYKFIPPSGFSRLGVRNNNPMLLQILNKSIKNITFEEKNRIIIKWLGSSFPKTSKEEKNLSFTLEEARYLTKKNEIKMCVNPNMLPFEEIDNNGKHKGISADIMHMISKSLNKPIVLVPTKTWSQSMENFQNKKCDVISLAINTPNRKQYMNFTKAYIKESLVIATKEDEFFVQDSSELQNKKIAAIKDSAFIELLKQRYPSIEIVHVNSPLEGLKKVQEEKVFGYVDALPAIAYIIQKNGILDLKIAGRLEFDVELSVATRQDEPHLNNILQKVLDKIGQDQIRTIVGKWISIKIEQSFDYKNLFYISIFFFTVLLVILYKNRSIKQINKQLENSHKEIEKQNKLLEELSVTDNLTKLFNRNRLDEVLISESNKTNRFDNSFGIIIIDIDHFKHINDTYGHLVGDTVLKELANILKTYSRKTDTVGRWGGEEFLIVCSETNLEGMITLAKHLQEKIADFPFSLNKKVTASFGVSEYIKNEKIDEMIKRADKALYQAKEKGRNKVEFL